MTENFVVGKVGGTSGVADLLFIHGLTGHLTETWTSPRSGEPIGDFWPKWICEDIPGINVYTLGYPATLFEKWVMREMALYERAKATLEYLASFDFGNRPIGFVTHSLGGLLAKQIIRTGSESSNKRWRRIAESARLVVFLATPHTGSGAASVLTYALPRLSSKHVNLLRSGDSELDQLNAAYRRLAPKLGITTAAFYEMHRTKKFAIVVDKMSADPGVPDTELIPVDADHSNICKPANRAELVYTSVRRNVTDLVENTAVESGQRRDIVRNSVQSHALSLSVYAEQVAREIYIVLPFDDKTHYSVPIRFIVEASSPKSVKDVFLHLEMSDFWYRHKLGRAPDKFSAARNISVMTDEGRSEHIARVLYKIPSLPPATKILIQDFIFAKSPTITPFETAVKTKDGKSGSIAGKYVICIPLSLTLDGEDVLPLSATFRIHFRRGDIEDFKTVKREENRLLKETTNVQLAEATFIGFKKFVKRGEFEGVNLMEADLDSAVGVNVRITPRGLEPRNNLASLNRMFDTDD